MGDTEIDKLVARQVMGWHPAPPRGAWSDGVKLYCNWHPTQDMGQAWQVAQAVLDTGASIQIDGPLLSPHKSDPPDWFCGFHIGSPVGTVYAEADTLQRAICLAALEVFERKEGTHVN